jgi:hypothetical protein
VTEQSLFERVSGPLSGRRGSDLPVQAVSDNIIFARGVAAGVYRVSMTSFEFLSTTQKEQLHAQLAWWMLKAESDFSIYRVCREYPADAYVDDTVSLIDERFADRSRWEALLASHAERIRTMRSFTPEVYLVVSLKTSSRIPFKRPGKDSALMRDAEQEAFETLIDNLPARRAYTREIQWLIRRAGVRGVCEPDVDPNWSPPALSLEGGVWSPGRADVEHFLSSVTERRRNLVAEGEDGESLQAVLAMGDLPKISDFPGNAELLFAPLESLDFPVDAVAHVRWIANKAMQNKADDAVKDANNAIDEALKRQLDRKTARRGDEALSVQDYYASEPYPPGLDGYISFAIGADVDGQDELKRRIKRLRRAYGSVRLHHVPALQAALYGDHLLRPDGAQVRNFRHLLTREQLAAMMPIGSHAAGAERGIYIAYTIPGAARPVAYNMLEASETNRAGAVELIGTLGGGKTVAMQLIESHAAARGSLVVDIDPRPDHSLEKLPGLEGRVHVISLANVEENRGLLDPLVVAPEELREELASSYMMEILPQAKPEWQTEIIDGVRSVLREPNPCSWKVVERLLASEDEHARAAGKALKVWAEWGIGRLAFSRDGRRHVEAEMPVTTIKAAALTLPMAGTQRSSYDQSERLSVATLKLITAFAMRLISDRGVHGVLGLDEAHVFTTTADGRRFLERIIRMGRSMNITVLLASQLLGDLAELEELIGVRFSFRQETDGQARANLRAHGLDETNEKLVQMLRNFSDGRCLMTGLDGRSAAIRFDPGEAFLRRADTNPSTIDMSELERQVAT